MKLNAYLELRGELRNLVYESQSSVDSHIDEDIDEYESRVHNEVSEIFRRVKKEEKERNE